MWVPGKTSVETHECIFPRFQVFSYFGKSRTANIDSDFFIWSYIFWSSSLTKNTVRWRYPNTSKLLLIRYPLDKGSQLNVLKTFRRLPGRLLSKRLIYIQFSLCVQEVSSRQVVLVFFHFFTPQPNIAKNVGPVFFTPFCNVLENVMKVFKPFGSMFYFCTPRKRLKTNWFLMFSRGYRNGTLTQNGLMSPYLYVFLGIG